MRVRTIAIAATLALLGACGGPKSVYVKGLKPLNENDRKESTPVDLRIYQLKDDARFKQAPVENLWVKPKEALGEDILGEKTITVFPQDPPGENKEVPLGVLPEATRFIGVLALYSKEDDKGPRRMVVAAAEAGSGVFELTGYHITWKR